MTRQNDEDQPGDPLQKTLSRRRVLLYQLRQGPQGVAWKSARNCSAPRMLSPIPKTGHPGRSRSARQAS